LRGGLGELFDDFGGDELMRWCGNVVFIYLYIPPFELIRVLVMTDIVLAAINPSIHPSIHPSIKQAYVAREE
jgi:hypothetical protein